MSLKAIDMLQGLVVNVLTLANLLAGYTNIDVRLLRWEYRPRAGSSFASPITNAVQLSV